MLTTRQQQVLDQVVAGRKSKEIARELHLSPETVDVHRRACLHKYNARNTAELVRKVTSSGDETHSGGDEG